MKKNTCIEACPRGWASYPTRIESGVWAIAGIVISALSIYLITS